ncbi:amidohydrolase family protein [Pleionea sp. CnH1-48]|uniref:amidohydrolase family protein n=1 Tax=Pleionea sp. CnH1-48 TaxID=2954494 RepID=UPI002097E85D|nr:amidohydrolase family protein [Pleionea sp. CnH1-48]MCO7226057.1 amidohydrolase family protein [Pleionea sp. CnH1-48]
MYRKPILLLCLLLCGLSIGPLIAKNSSSANPPSDWLLNRVTIISPERSAPLTNAWVHIKEGRIAQIGQGTPPDLNIPVIDGKHQYLTPGLMDSHVHLMSVPGMGFGDYGTIADFPDIAAEYMQQQPRSLLYFGITQLVDPAVPSGALKKFQQAPLHPDAFHCGSAPIVDGYPMLFLKEKDRLKSYDYFIYQQVADKPAPKGFDLSQHTPEAVVKRIAETDAVCIKLFIEDGFGGASHWPLISNNTIKRVKKAAEKEGLLVVGHANAIDMHQIALATDVDIIAHGLWNWNQYSSVSGMHPEIQKHLDNLIKQKKVMQPTMRVMHGLRELFVPTTLTQTQFKQVAPKSLLDWYQTPVAQWFKQELIKEDFEGIPEDKIAPYFDYNINQGKRAIQYLAQHDYPFVLASDFPSSPTYANQPGYTTYQEIQLMEEAGVSKQGIFAAATINNARAFKIDAHYGSVEAGKIANLLLLSQNPLSTTEAYDSIQYVILNGKMIERDSLKAH